mmetsp:Transcript_2641/g.4102  ORF Transcript_2641/g.4102 Transcript_2641/m.4102 type:complete len:86 (+) Transcript_2641:48-305(+)
MKQSMGSPEDQMGNEDSLPIIGFNEDLLLEGDKDNKEFLDKESLDSEFYVGLRTDIDTILLKAWDGKDSLSDEELIRFRDLMRYR